MGYEFGNVPNDPAQIPDFLRSELKKIQLAMNGRQERVRFDVLHREPERPRDGDEAEADGSDWNPGSGAGRYVYRSGAWVFLG
ncbi:hypothetical protein [Herbaspirillum sp. ST 5-3]|uniref:hypothetical protein n=1 Tax=Oxalobacteraceae TaxID=75682 RepID=UPI0010A3E038|nr:hypothetical protein [Herbaspirillum sp. ST 5-3]